MDKQIKKSFTQIKRR